MEIKKLLDTLDDKQPLLVCDIDEVVLHFVAPFEAYLAHQGMHLLKTSFSLAGNIIDSATGTPLSSQTVSALALRFHEHYVDQQPIIDDAKQVLHALSSHFQIVFLTNVAEELTLRRIVHLNTLGLNFPLLQNVGSKAQIVAELAASTTSATIFIDDLPMHHLKVKVTSPEVFCIHFMADCDFRKIAEITPSVAEKAENWQEIKNLCLEKYKLGCFVFRHFILAFIARLTLFSAGRPHSRKQRFYFQWRAIILPRS